MSDTITTFLWKEIIHHSATGRVMIERIITAGETPEDFAVFVSSHTHRLPGVFKDQPMMNVKTGKQLLFQHTEQFVIEGDTPAQAMLNLDAESEKAISVCTKNCEAQRMALIIKTPGSAQQAALAGKNGRG